MDASYPSTQEVLQNWFILKFAILDGFIEIVNDATQSVSILAVPSKNRVQKGRVCKKWKHVLHPVEWFVRQMFANNWLEDFLWFQQCLYQIVAIVAKVHFVEGYDGHSYIFWLFERENLHKKYSKILLTYDSEFIFEFLCSFHIFVRKEVVPVQHSKLDYHFDDVFDQFFRFLLVARLWNKNELIKTNSVKLVFCICPLKFHIWCIVNAYYLWCNSILTYCLAKRYRLSSRDAVTSSMKIFAMFLPAIRLRIFFWALNPISRALNVLSVMTVPKKKVH